jgi:NitT/TauT family transport system permease protein
VTEKAVAPVARPGAAGARRTTRGRTPFGIPLLGFQLGLALLFLVFWQLASGRLMRALFISDPITVARRVYTELFVDREVWAHLQVTLTEFAIGYLIGASVAIVLGVLLGRSRFLSAVIQPFIIGFYAIPKVALAPLFIVWFGLDMNSKIAMVTLFTFFIVFVNSYSGIRSIDEHFVNLARLMGASRWSVIRRIMLPSAAPPILLGLRTSIPYGMIGAVVGEFMASNRGIGYSIYKAAQLLDTPGVFAGIVILVVVVLLLTTVVGRLERRAVRWMPQVETRVSI